MNTPHEHECPQCRQSWKHGHVHPVVCDKPMKMICSRCRRAEDRVMAAVHPWTSPPR